MKVYTDLLTYHSERAPLAVAIGNFDGVHRGHHAIFEAVREQAKAIGGRSGVLTFKEHPQHVLTAGQKPRLLTSWFQKLSLLAKEGLDDCFLLHFTETLSKKEAADFVQEVLLGQLSTRAVCMGSGAKFGRGRMGDSHLMQRLAEEFGFAFREVGPVEVEGAPVSSTRIRMHLANGELGKVNRLLGRPYSITGQVVKGDARGRMLGFPTANLLPASDALLPEGVYAVLVDWIQDKSEYEKKNNFPFRLQPVREKMPGVLNYGSRPTFPSEGAKVPVVEVYLLDFDGELVGEMLEVQWVSKIRDEKRFSDREALIEQIRNDIGRAKELITKHRAAQVECKGSYC